MNGVQIGSEKKNLLLSNVSAHFKWTWREFLRHLLKAGQIIINL